MRKSGAVLNRNRRKGGEASRKNAAGKNVDNDLRKYKTTPDKYHNGAIPACTLLEDAMMRVFPELAAAKQRHEEQTEAAATESDQSLPPQPSSNDQAKNSRKQPSQQRQPELQQPDSVAVTSFPKPTPLDELLRWRFLGLAKQAQLDGGSCELGNTQAPAASKKKKRKKKKKGGDGKDINEGVTQDLPAAAAESNRNHTNGLQEGEIAEQIDLTNMVVKASPISIDARPTSDLEESAADKDLPLVLMLQRLLKHQDSAQDEVLEHNPRDSHRHGFFQWIGREFSSEISDSATQDRDWLSFVEICKQRFTSEENESFQIMLKDVVEIAEQIDCKSCQKATLETIGRWIEKDQTGSSPFVVVAMKPRYLDRTKPTFRGDEDWETSFCYQLMEEGTLPSKGSDDDSEVVEGDPSFCFLSFVLIRTNEQDATDSMTFNNGDKLKSLMEQSTRYRIQSKNIDVESLDNFFSDWLPFGASERYLMDTTTAKKGHGTNVSSAHSLQSSPNSVSKKRLSIIKKEVSSCLDAYSEFLNSGCEDNLLAAIENARPQLSSRDTIHLTANNILENCDNFCNHVIEMELVEMLLYAEEKVLADGEKPLEIIVWNEFLRALWDVSKCLEEYYKSMEEEVVDQNGVIPTMINNPRFRELCTEFVDKKIQIMSRVAKFIKETKTTAVMKERLTGGLWFQPEVKEKRQDKYIDLASDCKKIVLSLFEWGKIVRARRMVELRRTQRRKREILREKIKATHEILFQFQEEMEPYVAPEEQVLVETFRFSAEKVNSKFSIDLHEENEKVYDAAVGTILLWRALRIAEHRKLKSRSPATPPPLKEWMMGKESKLDLEYANQPVSCWHVEGGGRRARCILAGLFYHWLSNTFVEWKSEAAAQELLTDIDSEIVTLSQTVGGNTKSTKKSKRKKKPSSQSIPEKDEGNGPSQPSNDCREISDVKKEKTVEEYKLKDQTTNHNIVSSYASSEASDLSLKDDVDKLPSNDANGTHDLTPESCPVVLLDSGEKEEEQAIASQEDERSAYDVYPSSEPNVLVEDEDGSLIPACDFFIGRFVAVMDQVEKGQGVITMDVVVMIVFASYPTLEYCARLGEVIAAKEAVSSSLAANGIDNESLVDKALQIAKTTAPKGPLSIQGSHRIAIEDLPFQEAVQQERFFSCLVCHGQPKGRHVCLFGEESGQLQGN